MGSTHSHFGRCVARVRPLILLAGSRVLQEGCRTVRNFVSFEAISESVPRGVLISGIGQMVGDRKPFSDGEILLGLSPRGVIAMFRRTRLRLSDWKWEFHIHFNSYPQGRGEKD